MVDDERNGEDSAYKQDSGIQTERESERDGRRGKERKGSAVIGRDSIEGEMEGRKENGEREGIGRRERGS